MKTISVNASRSYCVTIGSGILDTLGAVIREQCPQAENVCIVSDSNVWPLYGQTVSGCLQHAGFQVNSYVFPAGESSKNGETYLSLLQYLAQIPLTRTDSLIALGGGVVGDLTGFAAATYLRGIAYVQVPTTLLAMVDSSVGGKTAIDLPAGKNLCGAFYQPWGVVCDLNTLQTLPNPVFQEGCAEVIKYAVLFDSSMFALLEQDGMLFDRETVITRGIQWKRDVVASDEFDRGQRKKLNLGHTVGHAVEKASGYTVSHGNSVAIGMAILSRASHCPDARRIIDLLSLFGLPVNTHYSAEVLAHHSLSDKKRQGSTIDLILPLAIGNCAIVPTAIEDLENLIRKGL